MKLSPLFLIFLLLIAGCISQVIEVKTEKNIPPPWSWNVKDPNNITQNHIKRLEKYNDILKSSPIPIFIINQHDLPEELKPFIEMGFFEKLHGLYATKIENKIWPDEFIFINSDASPETIIVTFFHEYQHYKCKINNCYCVAPNNLPKDEQIVYAVLREKHAMENELRMSLNLKDSSLVLNSYISTAHYILYSKNCIYKMAAICIIDGELWEQAGDFLSRLEKGKVEKVR